MSIAYIEILDQFYGNMHKHVVRANGLKSTDPRSESKLFES